MNFPCWFLSLGNWINLCLNLDLNCDQPFFRQLFQSRFLESNQIIMMKSIKTNPILIKKFEINMKRSKILSLYWKTFKNIRKRSKLQLILTFSIDFNYFQSFSCHFNQNWIQNPSKMYQNSLDHTPNWTNVIKNGSKSINIWHRP